MKFGLTDESLQIILQEIKSHLGETKNPKIYIYGSRVKGNYRKYSDIDILLCADSYDETTLSKIDFEELDIAYKVDFVLDKNLFEDYRDEIYEHKVLVLSVKDKERIFSKKT